MSRRFDTSTDHGDGVFETAIGVGKVIKGTCKSSTIIEGRG